MSFDERALTGLACLSAFLIGAGLYGPVRDALRRYRQTYLERSARHLDDLFLSLEPSRVLIVSVGLLVLMGLVAWAVAGTVWAAPPAGVVGYLIPPRGIAWLRRRRLRAFGDQMVDALQTMVNSLQAGLNLFQAIGHVAQEMPAPVGQEFSLLLREHSLGVTLDEALAHLSRRVPLDDVDLMVTTVTIARETGGNVADTLDSIAQTIRERRRLEGKVATLTAEGRTQAWVVGAMPVLMCGLFYLINPAGTRLLFETLPGLIMVGAGVLFEIVGILVIRRIIRIDI